MVARKLIINSDDFGLHKSVNEAIEIAHNKGMLTSASLMVNGDYFDDAVAIAKRHKKLGIGIHLTLNGEKAVAPPGKIYSLINKNGILRESHIELFKKILLRKVRVEHIAAESEAQIKKFIQSGLIPTHLDSHRHVHLFPPIYAVLIEIFKKYKIKKIRWVNIPAYDFNEISIAKLAFICLIKGTSFIKSKKFSYPDHFVGFFRSGNMDFNYIKTALQKLRPGVTEINFHPGKDDSAIKEKYGFWEQLYKWKCGWQKEFQVLINPEILKIINEKNIALINYSEF